MLVSRSENVENHNSKKEVGKISPRSSGDIASSAWLIGNDLENDEFINESELDGRYKDKSVIDFMNKSTNGEKKEGSTNTYFHVEIF